MAHRDTNLAQCLFCIFFKQGDSKDYSWPCPGIRSMDEFFLIRTSPYLSLWDEASGGKVWSWDVGLEPIVLCPHLVRVWHGSSYNSSRVSNSSLTDSLAMEEILLPPGKDSCCVAGIRDGLMHALAAFSSHLKDVAGWWVPPTGSHQPREMLELEESVIFWPCTRPGVSRAAQASCCSPNSSIPTPWLVLTLSLDPPLCHFHREHPQSIT